MSVGWLSGQVTSTVASLLGLRRSPLERMRRLFLLFAYLNVAVVTVLLTMHSRPGTGLRAMGYAGLAVLAVSWRSGRASGRSTGIVWLSDAAGLLLVAFALPDAGHGNGLVFSTIFLRSLYGSAGRVAVHVASAAGALAVAETLTAGWSGTTSPGFLPQLLVMPTLAALMHGSKTSLLHYEQGRERDRVLLQAGNALVGAVGPEAVAAVAVGAATAVVADPAARIGVLAGPPERLTTLAGDATAQELPVPVLAAIAEGRLVEYASTEPAGVVVAVPLLVQGRPGGALVIIAPEPIAQPRTETLVSLVNALALALESCSLAEDLHARKSEERIGALVRYASDAIVVLNPHGAVVYHTASTQRLLGYPSGVLTGMAWFSLLHDEDAAQFVAAYRDLLAEPGRGVALRMRVRHADGSWLHVETTATNLIEEPQVRGVVLANRDVTDRVELEAQLSHEAFHDRLTGLANRALFLDRLGHALARAARTAANVSMVLIDLDDFAGTNDSLGHGLGDRVLTEVAERLRGLVRSADTVARLGGDEFALLVEEVSGDQDAIDTAERVIAALRTPFPLGDRDLVLTASMGVVVAEPGDGVEDVLTHADLALYHAKSQGKSRYERYRPALHHALAERLELTNDLRHALSRAELTAYFQPIVSLASGAIVGAEALLRWNHATRGMISPATFIPLAEETGLIIPIGRWVLGCAIAHAAGWPARSGQPLSISVNLSACQLADPDLVGLVADTLERYRLPAPALTLEITETLLMHDTAVTLARLLELKQLGVRLAIDDFGTGYSSLGYLRRFPIDILKIDKCFIDNITAPGEDSALARTIVKLGQTLRLTTVAEGIEEADQARLLRQLGCDLGQGFHFARPMPAADFDALVHGQPQAATAGP